MRSLLLIGLCLSSPAWAMDLSPPPALVLPDVDLRDPILDLSQVQQERARRSIRGLMTAVGTELSVGLLATGSSDPDVRAFSNTLLVSSAIHGLSAWYQLDVNHRRSAAFASSWADVDGVSDEAMLYLANSRRLRVETDARVHAFTAGLYGGALVFGLSGLLTAGAMTAGGQVQPDRVTGMALGIGLFGAIGLSYHASRWRLALRASHDLDALRFAVPNPQRLE